MPISSQPEAAARLEFWMTEYGDSLLRLCFLYLKDVHLAEDAVQETFLHAYAHYREFEGRAGEKTWLTRIAVNACKDMIRTRWFRTPPAAADPQTPAPDALEPALERAVLTQAILRLPPDDRILLTLFYYQGFTAREIAQILHKREGSVLQRLHRARLRLKGYLTEVGYDGTL